MKYERRPAITVSANCKGRTLALHYILDRYAVVCPQGKSGTEVSPSKSWQVHSFLNDGRAEQKSFLSEANQAIEEWTARAISLWCVATVGGMPT